MSVYSLHHLESIYGYSVVEVAERLGMTAYELSQCMAGIEHFDATHKNKLTQLFNLKYDKPFDDETKYVFFDYDNTFLAHFYPKIYRCDVSTYYQDCVYLLTKQEYMHQNDIPIDHVIEECKRAANLGHKLFCLTHQCNNLRSARNQEQIKKYFGDVEVTYLETYSPESKIDMIKAHAFVNAIPLPHCYLIDDRGTTIDLANKERIVGVNTSYIAAGGQLMV